MCANNRLTLTTIDLKFSFSEDGKSETGGASGGSIKLQTGALYGKGKLQVNGGQG
jgi:hypothetical protein